MAKVSQRVKGYASAKGVAHKMSTVDIYWKTEELRTVLLDIAHVYKVWGREWYDLVERSLFDKAQIAVITHGKGAMVAETVALIEELAALEAQLKARERGEM